MLGWYAAEVHRHEIAVEHLGRQGIATFDPKVRSVRVRRGKKVESVRRYIPGYVFCSFDVESERWRFINSTLGVKRLISAGEEPVRINDRAMAVILDRCVDGYVVDAGLLDAIIERVVKGTDVEVLSGPFAGAVGKATRNQIGDRVWIAMNIFNRETKLVTDRNSVRIIAPRSPGLNS